jgi:hypothetical protein
MSSALGGVARACLRLGLLFARGAPLEAQNCHGGAPLSTAMRAAGHERKPAGFAAQVLPRLFAAGPERKIRIN